MNKKFFPGANSGEGFYSRFDGIVPPYAPHHYIYVLKGGPGVGKNTLMKKAARRAVEKGYEVEEFRCASDPKSLDAIRIPKLCIAVLDGTSPHSIDPMMPGIRDEIIDLGHFKGAHEFAGHRETVSKLLTENKKYYSAAYSMLSAACALKREAIKAAYESVNVDKLHAFLSRLVSAKKQGRCRELFARSATPDGVIDFSSSFLPEDVVRFTGIVGEIALIDIKKMLIEKQCEIYYDFLDPQIPHCIIMGESAIAVADGGDLLGAMCNGVLSAHVAFCVEKSEQLIKRATSELSKALLVHDKIEEIYRDYVDYDRVNEESEKLLVRMGL